MKIDFTHRHAAHCESGVTANLLAHAGLPLSEAMAFGLGGGLFFGYFPFVKINHQPLITYRKSPGGIFKKATARLGARVHSARYRRPAAGQQALDALLAQGVPVGVQTGVYWLPYFPPALRFHFNAHNLVVYGKEGDDYLISDPVLESPVRCAAADLERARYARGALAPKGRLYYLRDLPNAPDLTPAIREAILEVCRMQVGTPMPLIGVRGMRLLARHLRQWPQKLGRRKAILALGHLIRMQEEIGTGGGGFRFIYAAFLQEAAPILGRPALEDRAREMTAIGDAWRNFAADSARLCKGRGSDDSFAPLAEQLLECADREERFFRALHAEVRR